MAVKTIPRTRRLRPFRHLRLLQDEAAPAPLRHDLPNREPGLFTSQKNARPGTHSEAGKIQEIVAVSMALLLRSVKLRFERGSDGETSRRIKNTLYAPYPAAKMLATGRRTVFDLFVAIFARVMSWMFVIGVIGCLFVIPITAYRLFAVLFDEDRSDEE